MMNNKKILIVVLALVLVGGLVYYFTQNKPVQNTDTQNSVGDESGRRMEPTTPEEQQPIGKLKVINFSGKLEKVDTGCFADGECFAVVDGKHITAIMGWSQAVVGTVLGVEGFGDLESHIGEQVEVYAQDKGDGTYTLYGSSGFYIKLK